jgi:hypothetical protein
VPVITAVSEPLSVAFRVADIAAATSMAAVSGPSSSVSTVAVTAPIVISRAALSEPVSVASSVTVTVLSVTALTVTSMAAVSEPASFAASEPATAIDVLMAAVSEPLSVADRLPADPNAKFTAFASGAVWLSVKTKLAAMPEGGVYGNRYPPPNAILLLDQNGVIDPKF